MPNIDNWKNTDDSSREVWLSRSVLCTRIHIIINMISNHCIIIILLRILWFHSLPTSTATHIRRYDLRLIHLRRWGGRRRVRATTFLFILNIVFVGEFRRVSGSGICIGNNIIHKVSATERIVNAGHSI